VASGVDAELRIVIAVDADIVTARQEGRRLASELGFSPSDLTVIAAAISEVARNILEYAGRGEVNIRLVEKGGRRGVLVTVTDEGPGIPDLNLALQDGFSTSGGLGLGLPGARRLMDEFEIRSEMGKGTTVTMRKWTR
jgi:serine/threonine-protein kinase RsbT